MRSVEKRESERQRERDIKKVSFVLLANIITEVPWMAEAMPPVCERPGPG